MMTRTKWLLLIPAVFCLIGALFICGSLGATKIQYGSTASVPGSWFNWLWTLLGGGTAFSLPALWALLQKWFPRFAGGTSATPVEPDLLSSLLALGAATAALMRNSTDKSAIRAFVFALLDVATFIPHLDTSHDKGVIVLRYDVFAELPSPEPTPAPAFSPALTQK